MEMKEVTIDPKRLSQMITMVYLVEKDATFKQAYDTKLDTKIIEQHKKMIKEKVDAYKED